MVVTVYIGKILDRGIYPHTGVGVRKANETGSAVAAKAGPRRREGLRGAESVTRPGGGPRVAPQPWAIGFPLLGFGPLSCAGDLFRSNLLEVRLHSERTIQLKIPIDNDLKA